MFRMFSDYKKLLFARISVGEFVFVWFPYHKWLGAFEQYTLGLLQMFPKVSSFSSLKLLSKFGFLSALCNEFSNDNLFLAFLLKNNKTVIKVYSLPLLKQSRVYYAVLKYFDA